ncbi:MAG: hypothetical protein R3F11_23290 [Verrucomicrobiales bacterium]
MNANSRPGCASPRSSGRNERPSIPAGISAPAAASSVGITSIPVTKCAASSVPALTCPGQRATSGVRVLCR